MNAASNKQPPAAGSWIGSMAGFVKLILLAVASLAVTAAVARAGEADLAIPNLHEGTFTIFGGTISAFDLLLYGALVITGTLGISLYLRTQIHRLPAHQSMLNVAEIIFQTCKTYLIQQGKFLLMLFAIIACAMTYYFVGLQGETLGTAAMVLLFSVVGMGG